MILLLNGSGRERLSESVVEGAGKRVGVKVILESLEAESSLENEGSFSEAALWHVRKWNWWVNTGVGLRQWWVRDLSVRLSSLRSKIWDCMEKNAKTICWGSAEVATASRLSWGSASCVGSSTSEKWHYRRGWLVSRKNQNDPGGILRQLASWSCTSYCTFYLLIFY